MVNRPSVPEIITVNSEALQTQIRDLLPSQNGFGSELQASNVITPIIDLTSTAEGSGLPSNLQTALAYGSNTPFNVVNGNLTLVTSPGFYRVVGVCNIELISSTRSVDFSIDDTLSIKKVWEFSVPGTGTGDNIGVASFDLVFFLRAGDKLIVTSTGPEATIAGSHRQLATGDGTLVPPSGYPL